MTDTTPACRRLHEAYCRESGFVLPLTMQRIWKWEAWSHAGYVEADLGLVIRHIKTLEKEGRRWSNSLYFRNLIENTERFGEDLAEARALARPKQPSMTRVTVKTPTMTTERLLPSDGCGEATKSAGAILSGPRFVEALKKLRQSLE